MKCLIVKQAFAQWIVQDAKHIEWRKQRTYIRGRIGIMEPGTWHSPDGLMRRIVGDVDLYDCYLEIDGIEKGNFRWCLRNPRTYKTPVFVPLQRGPQVWVNAEYEEPTEFLPLLTGTEQLYAELDCIHAERIFFQKYKGFIK